MVSTLAIISSAASGTTNAAGVGSMLTMLIPLALIILFFWLFIIRPEKKRNKEMQDMLSNIQVADEVIELEHIAQVLAALLGEPLFAHVPELVAADGDVAAVGAVDAADDVQQGGFAAAGGAQQHADLPLGHGEIHAPQHLLPGVAGAVALLQVHDLQEILLIV